MQYSTTRSSWGRFAGGVGVGIAAGLAAVGLAVVAERRRRAQAERTAGPPDATPQPPVVYPPEDAGVPTVTRRSAGATHLDEELDEELAETFPASDPLPRSHRVD